MSVEAAASSSPQVLESSPQPCCGALFRAWFVASQVGALVKQRPWFDGQTARSGAAGCARVGCSQAACTGVALTRL